MYSFSVEFKTLNKISAVLILSQQIPQRFLFCTWRISRNVKSIKKCNTWW